MTSATKPVAVAPESAPVRSIAADLAAEFRSFHGFEVAQIRGLNDQPVEVAVVPQGKAIYSLQQLREEALPRPRRRRGTARLQDAASFIAHVARFGTPEAGVIFADADPAKPSFTAVYDYHRAEPQPPVVSLGLLADWLQHRAVYACPLSPAWIAWSKIAGKELSQADFAQFIEERLGDVILPPSLDEDATIKTLIELQGGRLAGPSALVTMSRGLEISVASRVKQAVTLESGEIRVTFEEQHADGSGRPIEVPNFFVIALPVFLGGAPYRMPVRIRYRVKEQRVTWSLHLHRADLVFEHAFAELREQIAAATSLPLFAGAPEA